MRLLIIILCLLINQICLADAGKSQIYGQLVTTGGATSGSAFTISGVTSAHEPKIAFYDDRFLVVWQEWDTTYDRLEVKAARIALNGTVLDSPVIDLASGTRNEAMPDVSADGSGWVVVYHSWDSTDVFPTGHAVRINYDGSLGTNTSFGSTSDSLAANCKIAYDPVQGKHLILYTGFYDAVSSYVRFRWGFLSTAVSFTSISAGAGKYGYLHLYNESYQEISENPSGTWSMLISGPAPRNGGYASSVSAGHVEASGTLDTDGYYSENVAGISASALWNMDSNIIPYGDLDIANDGTYLIGVWTRYASDTTHSQQSMYGGDLYGIRIDEDTANYVGSQGGTAMSAVANIQEEEPALSSDGAGNLLLTYDSMDEGSVTINGRIVTANGAGISSGTEFPIRDDTTGGRRSHSASAYSNDVGNEKYLVVWTEGWWGAL